MSDQPNPATPQAVSEKRLWFGTFGAGVAWTLTGIVDIILAWRICLSGPVESGSYDVAGVHIMYGFITFGLLAVSIVAGVMSFLNWRAYSHKTDFVAAEGRTRREFMSIAGVYVAASLAVGIIWYALAIYLISVCVKAN